MLDQVYHSIIPFCTGYCIDGDVRLAGSSDYIRGRVEVCYGQVWGTVCGSNWGTVEALVVCRQLGLVSAGKRQTDIAILLVNIWYDIYCRCCSLQ